MRCPTCDRTFTASESTTIPFCSPRCRQIDLARWLDEKHSVPSPPSEDDPDEYPEDSAE